MDHNGKMPRRKTYGPARIQDGKRLSQDFLLWKRETACVLRLDSLIIIWFVLITGMMYGFDFIYEKLDAAQ